MRLSILALFRGTFALIKQDPILLAPGLISAFIIYSVETQYGIGKALGEGFSVTPEQVAIILLNGVIQLFFAAATYALATSQIRHGKVDLRQDLGLALRKMPHLIVGMLIVFFPLYLTIAVFYGLSQFEPALPLLRNLLLVVLTLVWVLGLMATFALVQIFPVMVISEQKRWFRSVAATVRFAKTHLSEMVLLSFLIIFIQLITTYLSLFFQQIPLVGDAVFRVFFRGMGLAVSYVLTVVLFYTIKAFETPKPSVDVYIDDNNNHKGAPPN